MQTPAFPAAPRAAKNRALLRTLLTPLTAFGLLLSAHAAVAQNVAADSVSANGAPARWSHSSCQAPISALSDSSIANPGVCYLAPLDPTFEMTFTFSPANASFMQGIDIWANAGNSMSDNELRQLDVEVDYFDPATNATQTLTLNDVNIGDTTSFNDPKRVAFAAPGSGLYQVSEVRISELVGIGASGRVVFREVQGAFATLPVAPEINVASSESGAVSDGGTDAHGTEAAGAPNTVTYTITNTGTDTLTLGGTPTVSGETNIAGAVTVSAPGALNLAPGESTTFDVTYTPAAGGAYGFDISVPNNDADEGPYDIAVSGTANEAPTVTLTADPTNPPAGPFSITATFSEPVTGMSLADFNTTNGTATSFANPAPGVYTVVITPIDPNLPIGVIVPANAANDSDGSPNAASNSLGFVVVAAPTITELSEIENIIIEETERDLRESIAFNQRAMRDARDRHAGYLRCRNLNDEIDENGMVQLEELEGCPALRGLSVEPTFTGKLTATEDGASGDLSFVSKQVNLDDTRRRIATADLSFNRFDDGDTSATLAGRVAWERVVGDDVLRGLFIGATATKSDIDDTFAGTRTGFGLNAGAYFVDQLDENLFWDGFIQIGLGQNNLELGNGTIDVDGDYDTRSLQLGLAVTGERNYDRFDVYPELSLAYGITSVGDAELVSDNGSTTATTTLSVSDVELGIIRFRPEVVFPGETNRFGIAESSLSVAPSLLCEAVRTTTTETDCGGGLEIEWTSRSEDGLSAFSARASREIVGGATRDQLGFFYERQF